MRQKNPQQQSELRSYGRRILVLGVKRNKTYRLWGSIGAIVIHRKDLLYHESTERPCGGEERAKRPGSPLTSSMSREGYRRDRRFEGYQCCGSITWEGRNELGRGHLGVV